jgi:hypothetical protein
MKLDYSNKGLKELPEIPEGVTHLYCWGNQLTELPALPATLTELYCEGHLKNNSNLNT